MMILLFLVFAVVESSVLFRRALDSENDMIFEATDDEAMPMYDSNFFYADMGPGAGPSRYRPGDATKTHSCGTVYRSIPAELRSAAHMHPRGLTYYYQKYTEAYGIPIASSNNPPDDALKRACYVVRFMLADRYDVRNMLYHRHGRVGVIGRYELTNGIPEHSHLPAWWNTRARGLGAMDEFPICTNAEENILCYGRPPDNWHGADILVHEFSHGVHMIGAKFAISGFDARLQAVYNRRRSENRRWAGTYAMTNRIEMFAEATESYFDVNAHANPSDGIHNHVSTRAVLKTYDPELYALVQEVFPCGNRIIDRCTKSRSQEQNQNIRMHCAGGDGGTDGDKDKDKDKDKKGGDCQDTHQHCHYWQGEGYCSGEHADYMKQHCPKSCNKCEEEKPVTKPKTDPPTDAPACKDKNVSKCAKLKKKNKLKCSKKKFKKMCAKSCGQC